MLRYVVRVACGALDPGEERAQRRARDRGEVGVRPGRGQREAVAPRACKPAREQMAGDADLLEARGEGPQVGQCLVCIERDYGGSLG